MIRSDKRQRGINVNKSGRRLVVSTQQSFRIQAEPWNKYAHNDNDGRIVMTPFEIKDNYDTYPNIDYDGKDIDFKYSIIDIRTFGYAFERLSKRSLRVLFNMLYNLENDTNVVRFNINELVKYKNYDQANEYNNYKELIERGLIIRTNLKCTYIINHNVFYKGDLNKFREKYLKFYKDRDLEYNEKGEVIITNL